MFIHRSIFSWSWILQELALFSYVSIDELKWVMEEWITWVPHLQSPPYIQAWLPWPYGWHHVNSSGRHHLNHLSWPNYQKHQHIPMVHCKDLTMTYTLWFWQSYLFCIFLIWVLINYYVYFYTRRWFFKARSRNFSGFFYIII